MGNDEPRTENSEAQPSACSAGDDRVLRGPACPANNVLAVAGMAGGILGGLAAALVKVYAIAANISAANALTQGAFIGLFIGFLIGLIFRGMSAQSMLKLPRKARAIASFACAFAFSAILQMFLYMFSFQAGL